MLAKRDRQHQTTLVMLAGGLGSRMGRPKAAMQIRGEPILTYLLRQLCWRGPTMLVTATGRTSPPGSELFGCEVVDSVEGQGPLRGILTAMEHAPGDLVVVTVDMPSTNAAMNERLVEALSRRPKIDGLMYETTSGNETRVEPFPSIFRASARDAIARSLDETRRSVRGLLRNPKFAAISAPSDWPPGVWTNLNTPEDVAAFEKSLGGGDKM